MGVGEGECLVERIMSVVVGLSASLSLLVVGLIQLAHCCGGGGVLGNVALLMWDVAVEFVGIMKCCNVLFYCYCGMMDEDLHGASSMQEWFH